LPSLGEKVAKVKKTAKKASRRNVRAGKPAAKKARGAVRGRSVKKPVRKVEAPVRYTIKALDSLRKCGPGTSVQLLFRVDERRVDGGGTTHLVYFDKHGWYCEHGRTCPAVVEAKKYSGHMARGSRGASH
jgi:hypothetical protein